MRAFINKFTSLFRRDGILDKQDKSRSTHIDNFFWEKQHKKNDNYWLTGSTLKDIMQFHDLAENDIRDKSVLEIGVGKGNLINELKELTDKIICCDISEEALVKVSKLASKTYLTKDLHLIEPVDLALCHLVFQHCTNQEMERIIKEVNLSEHGIFSFQFAFLRENEQANKMVRRLINSGSHHFRSLKDVEGMINRANKEIISISKSYDFFQPENFSWFIVKIKNKKAL